MGGDGDLQKGLQHFYTIFHVGVVFATNFDRARPLGLVFTNKALIGYIFSIFFY